MEAVHLIYDYCNNFSLSIIARKELIKLTRELLPNKNKLPKNYDSLLKVVSQKDLNKLITIKKFCSNCDSLLNNNNECNNNECKLKKAKVHFLYICEFSPQFKNLLTLFISEMHQNNYKNEPYVDINNAFHYESIKKIPNTIQITLTLCSDGVAIRNNGKSVWPVLLSINEFSPLLRSSYKTKIIGALWEGEKPKPHLLYPDLLNALRELEFFNLTINETSYAFKINLYGILFDSPALALSLNVKQFNGYFGCPICLNPGLRPKEFRKMIYPTETYSRKDTEMYNEANAKQGFFRRAVFCDSLSLPDSIMIDYMHVVLEGIFKDMIKIWLSRGKCLANGLLLGNKLI